LTTPRQCAKEARKLSWAKRIYSVDPTKRGATLNFNHNQITHWVKRKDVNLA
jgi:hypothetical protein